MSTAGAPGPSPERVEGPTAPCGMRPTPTTQNCTLNNVSAPYIASAGRVRPRRHGLGPGPRTLFSGTSPAFYFSTFSASRTASEQPPAGPKKASRIGRPDSGRRFLVAQNLGDACKAPAGPLTEQRGHLISSDVGQAISSFSPELGGRQGG